MTQTIVVGGRDVLVDIPSFGWNGGIILALHGALGNAKQFKRDTGLSDVARGAKLAVAYPQGTDQSPWWWPSRLLGEQRSFNAVGCCGEAADAVDDVGWLGSVITRLVRDFGVTKVVLTGISNGAMMSMRLAERDVSFRVVGVVAVAGTLTTRLGEQSHAPFPPCLTVHGNDDLRAPYAGGFGYDRSFYHQSAFEVGKAVAALRGVTSFDFETDELAARTIWTTASQFRCFETWLVTRMGHEWIRDSRLDLSELVVTKAIEWMGTIP